MGGAVRCGVMSGWGCEVWHGGWVRSRMRYGGWVRSEGKCGRNVNEWRCGGRCTTPIYLTSIVTSLHSDHKNCSKQKFASAFNLSLCVGVDCCVSVPCRQHVLLTD